VDAILGAGLFYANHLSCSKVDSCPNALLDSQRGESLASSKELRGRVAAAPPPLLESLNREVPLSLSLWSDFALFV